ncbi:hypothetical protein LTR43_012178 [Exophiala xenobiotica]
MLAGVTGNQGHSVFHLCIHPRRSSISGTWLFLLDFRGGIRTGVDKNRSGLIDSDESDAVRWNHYKRKLSKQIEAGQRWLKFADKFGWSALGLVTRDWFIEENKVLANDRIFEEILATSEHGTLLDEIEAVKGRFLRQLNKTLGGSLFDLLEDSSRAQGLPLLKLDDHDILTRPDCDQSWLDDFHLEEI